MKPNFTGPSYTLGIEEELMILDRDVVGPRERDRGPAVRQRGAERRRRLGGIKPELHESVLEIATKPCADTREAGAELRGLRRQVAEIAARRDLTIGSAGTHPFALWEDQRISARPRYRDLIDALRFVARQEVIFGLHVHVGIDDADKAIHVANGMRVHVPVLLALSANSPFWRGQATGLASTRMPIFRQFPRVGMPPAYDDWKDFEERIGFMVDAKTIEDYTYLWYDVRPHPNFGTVEIRAMDGQTRVEHTLGAGGADPGDGQGAGRALRGGRAARRLPVRDARREPLDRRPPRPRRRDGRSARASSASRRKALARRLYDRLREHAQDLGSADELEGIDDLLERGNGAHRQRSSTRPTTISTRSCARSPKLPSRSSRRRRLGGVASGPELFVVCKKCNSEVSPYITECPYCGTRLRKRAPKLDKGGTPRAAKRRRERPKLSRLKPGEIPGVRADRPAVRDDPAGRSSRSSSRSASRRGSCRCATSTTCVATSPLDGE